MEWSCPNIRNTPSFNISDRNSKREYTHTSYGGHVGAYFGPGMELEAKLDPDYIDGAWTDTTGTKIIKSHHWAYKLHDVKAAFPDDWIMLVYRPDMPSYTWWHQAGGFEITYPDYSWYGNSSSMMNEIAIQNRKILEYAHQHDATWRHFSSKWIEDNFGHSVQLTKNHSDILVTIIK